MAQHFVADIGLTVVGIDQRAVFSAGDGVDGQVAPRQVFFQRDIDIGIHLKALVAFGCLAFSAREGVLLLRFGMEKNRKILADRAVTQRDHLLRRGADDDVIAVLDRQSEQRIAHCAADLIYLHLLVKDCD